MKKILFLVFSATMMMGCTKAKVETSDKVETSYYTISVGTSLIPLGAPVPHFNLTGNYIQPQNNLIGTYIYGTDFPKGKTVTITATITSGDPSLSMVVYKTNVLSTQNEVKKTNGQGTISVTFTTE